MEIIIQLDRKRTGIIAVCVIIIIPVIIDNCAIYSGKKSKLTFEKHHGVGLIS
jgi:hypothetical protein